MVMDEASLSSIGVYKIHPILPGRIGKYQAIQPFRGRLIKNIDIDITNLMIDVKFTNDPISGLLLGETIS